MAKKRTAKAKSAAKISISAEEKKWTSLLESSIAKAVGGQLLSGRKIIYSRALPVIYGAQQSIKVVSYAGGGPKSPEWFHYALTDRLKEAKGASEPLFYEVALAINPSSRNFDFEDFVTNTKKRLQVFEDAGVSDRVHLLIVETNDALDMELIVIDKSSAQISFSTARGKAEAIQRAIFFEHRRDLCTELADWFDNRVKDQAIKFDEWIERKRIALTTEAATRRLPQEMLNPRIREKVWKSFMQSHFDTAAFESMKAVEVAVREAAGLSNSDFGTNLMRKAFDVNNGPLTDPNAASAERQARSDLFAGSIGSYKNPHSHRHVGLHDPTETAEIVLLANHLLRIVDARLEAKTNPRK